MDRRNFSAFVGCGFALPLLFGSAHAAELDAAAELHASSELSVDEIVTRVESFYENVTTFKTSFVQRSRYDELRSSAGSLIFERPGKMSWRYTSTGNRIVSDGTRIRVYERDCKQLYEQEAAASQFPAALSFLIDAGQLRQTFRFTRPDPKRVSGGAGGWQVLLAEPLQPSPVFARLVFYVDARRHEVCRVQIVDNQGNRSRFDFAAGKVNLRVPQGEFVFNPPRGTQIIRPMPSPARP